MEKTDIASRVELRELKTLSDNHYTLRKAIFAYRRRDGAWQETARESYDIGDGAAVLPIDAARDKVLLIKQFRWPAFEQFNFALDWFDVVAGEPGGFASPNDSVAPAVSTSAASGHPARTRPDIVRDTWRSHVHPCPPRGGHAARGVRGSAAATTRRSSAVAAATGGVYRVRQGDTLSEIAVANGVTVTQLKRLNGLNGDGISVGQRLKVK